MLKLTIAAATVLATFCHGFPSVARRQSGPSAIVSSSDGQYKLSPGTAPVQGAGDPGSGSTWSIRVDDTASGHKQSVTGFGAAITDATVSVFNALPAAQRAAAMHDVFSSDGLGFSLMRHTIAASDLSATVYSYDDAANDNSLSSFDLGPNGNAMASFISSAKAIQSSLTLLGSVWSPPGWMKLNGVMSGTTVNNNLDDSKADIWAQYFVKYIQAFNAAGANVDAVTIQNEPLNSQSGYPTMYVYANEAAGLINNNLGPALAGAGLSTKIWGYDHNTGTLLRPDPQPHVSSSH